MSDSIDMEYTPVLTLHPDDPTEVPAAPTQAQIELQVSEAEQAAAALDLSRLSEAEQKAVREFAEKIDITDTNVILSYGAGAQKNIADFSSSTLNTVRAKDMGDVGGMLSGLVVELQGFQAEEDKKGIFGMFKKGQRQIAAMKAQYDKAEVSVNKIVGMLEGHQVTLMKDIAMLDKMYEMNLAYFKELTMYILAGKQKLQACQETRLAELQERAKNSGLPEDAQAANDYANMLSRFDKKLHDLELTRIISIQMAPQIRLIQNNNALMVEKIQSSIVNTIPLWKSQMVLALGMHHSQQAMEAQRSVTNVTNELLRKNSEALKVGSIEVAKESERGIVDLETLKQTNQNLIDTIDEVRQIQVEGAKRRREAEVELGRIEGELKQKLLEVSNR